jgi:hypothetical protein
LLLLLADDNDDDAFLGRLQEFPGCVDALRTVDFLVVFDDDTVTLDAAFGAAAVAVDVVDDSVVKKDFFAGTPFFFLSFLFFAVADELLRLLQPAAKKDAIDVCTLCGCALRVAASLSLRTRLAGCDDDNEGDMTLSSIKRETPM